MPTRNHWKTLTSKEVYRNPWMRVREDKVIRPDGKEGIYGVVETRVATGVCALTDKGEVVLVGQYRYATERYSWEIVEGGADLGEPPLEAIQRELQEEAGLKAEHWTPLSHELQLTNCISSEMGYIFMAEGLSEVEPDPEETEVLQIRFEPLEKCLEMIEEGEITDAISIMGLLLLDRHLRKSARKA